MRIGRSLLAGDRRYPALESVLRREPFDRDVQTTDLDEMAELVLSLDGAPPRHPGPARLGQDVDVGAADRAPARRGQAGRRRLDEPQGDPQAARRGRGGAASSASVRGRQEGERRQPRVGLRGRARSRTSPSADDCGDGAARSAARPGSSRTATFDGALDYLFIDEAGQVSLADALAMGTARAQPRARRRPAAARAGAPGLAPRRRRRLRAHSTCSASTRRSRADRGLFLERTFRLHPDVCGYISEEFYEGRLRPDPVRETRTTPLGTGLRFLAGRARGPPAGVAGGGRARSRREVERLLAAGVRRGGRDGRRALQRAGQPAARAAPRRRCAVGTVDKFQGQEAPVVLYSMASSSGEDVPRGLEFLLSRNRLNVAISRAQCLAYLVC